MDSSEQHPGPEPTDLSHDLRTRSLRVHDVIISGTTRTQRHVIERKLRSARAATTPEELQTALDEAQHELRELRIFESVNLVADAGPKELPDTANILVTVLEPTNALTTSIAAYRQVYRVPPTCHRFRTVITEAGEVTHPDPIQVSGHLCSENVGIWK